MDTWKIAGGVFLGLLAFAGVERYIEARREAAAIAAINAGISQMANDMTRMDAENRAQIEARVSKQQYLDAERDEAQRLKEDERCINRQRFRRVPNGWVQTGSC